MKFFSTRLLPLLILFISSLSNAQQIVQQQYSFIGKSMATWCLPCGTWGWDLEESLIQQNAGKAIVVSLYGNNDQFLQTPTAVSLIDNFGPSSSIPAWYVNGTNETYYQGNGIVESYTESNVDNTVATAYAKSALANSNFTYSITGDSLKVDAQTEFFDNTSGAYYLSIYIVENNVAAPQNGRGNPGYPTTKVSHDNVLRAAATPNDFGKLVASGSINAGSTYSTSFATKLNSTWATYNIWLAAVIWKKTTSSGGIHYDYVNGFSNLESMTDGIKPFEGSNLQVNALANPVTSASQFSISTDKTVKNISVALFDILGKQVLTVYKGELTEGVHSFMLDPHALANGLYLMQITDGKEKYVRKLIVQK